MITVIKQDPLGRTQIQYQGEVMERSPYSIVIQAHWTRLPMDLGYVRFETGDHFTEYYYTDRWFNIFAIASPDHVRKGWYCNIAEPADISQDEIRQKDLLLDLWINPDGTSLILDEDEFAAATFLTDEQRGGARRGLQVLLQMLAARQEMFAEIKSINKKDR
jgi:predicted RNA-binding protein associated with RNAse of E/G family